jgi:RNA polymerase sigma factor (sigma-70 family)
MVAPALRWESVARGGNVGPSAHWLVEVSDQQGPSIKHMLRRMLRQEEDVLDVYQDCMHHLLRRARTAVVDNVAGYAARTACNLAIELLRRRKRRSAHWSNITAEVAAASAARSEPDAGGHDTDDSNRKAVRCAVNCLPPHLRDVIVLRDYQHLPYRRVAELLNIKPTTARVYRRQAIVRLGVVLQSE